MEQQNEANLSCTSHDKCTDKLHQPRTRKRKRPYSPEVSSHDRNRKITVRAKVKKRDSIHHCPSSHINGFQAVSFSCDQCGSATVVDPSRCRLPPGQTKKVQTIRKKLDPVTNKILNLCNACGLAFSRPPKKSNKINVAGEDRVKYLAEAVAFAKSVAESVGKPAAERLFCPSFKSRPCSCIQTYLSHPGDSENTLEYRVDSLLQFFNTACDLNRRKSLFPQYAEDRGDTSTKSVERKQRQRDYEHFVLETRQLLREKLHLCERACQRILLYSNNFLHKRLKSSPDQSSRISRTPGWTSASQLKSIEELGSLPCCSDSCSRLALTHSNLLEEWRKQAAQGQRQARRVLAEMLTPSGGTKANCYKFITMVTGCGPNTISSVSHQMRITKGNREPPEHGLKKWYRENPRKTTKSLLASVNTPSDQHPQLPCSLSVSSNHLGHVEATTNNQEQDHRILVEQLEKAKHQLFLKQQEVDRCHLMMNQHLQQQVQPCQISETELITFPVESNESIMSGLSSGQPVQLIDLVPGTYIAFPSSFNSTPFLPTDAVSKQSASNSEAVPVNDLQNEQEVVYSGNLHPLSSQENISTLIHSENGTIYTISSAQDINPVLEGVEPLESSYSDILVTSPSNCGGPGFSYPDTEKSCNESVTCSDERKCVGPSHNSALLSLEDTPNHTIHSAARIPTSCPISVIMPPNNLNPGRPSEQSTECSKGVSEFDLSTSLNNVILVSASEQSQSSSICLNPFDRLFE